MIAIENVRLFDEVQGRTRDLSESLEQQTATSEVLQVISNLTDELQPVLDAILETAGRLCQSEYAVLFQLQDGDLPCCRLQQRRGGLHRIRVRNIRLAWIAARSLAARRSKASTVHIPDSADPEYTAHDNAPHRRHRSLLGVPLLQ